MCGWAPFFHDIVEGGKNRARGDNFSEWDDEPLNDDDAEGFSTTSLLEVDDESLLDELGSQPMDDRNSIPPPAPCFQRSIRNGRAKSTSNAMLHQNGRAKSTSNSLKHRRRPWTKLYDGQQSKSLLH
jgi:hypothetical protein